MKCQNTLPQKIRWAFVRQDIVSDGEPFGTTGLGGEYGVRLFRIAAITRQKALQLQRFGAVNHQHAIEACLRAGLGQQRNHVDHVVPCRARRELFAARAYRRLHDGFEFAPESGIGKNYRAKGGAIQAPVGQPHVIAETLEDLLQYRRADRLHFARNEVRVDECDTQIGEHRRDGTLAAGDAARQRDAPGVGSGRVHRPGEPLYKPR